MQTYIEEKKADIVFWFWMGVVWHAQAYVNLGRIFRETTRLLA